MIAVERKRKRVSGVIRSFWVCGKRLLQCEMGRMTKMVKGKHIPFVKNHPLPSFRASYRTCLLNMSAKQVALASRDSFPSMVFYFIISSCIRILVVQT